MIVACLGDSITAGSPLWDPNPALRATIAEPDERSQWHWWAARAHPGFEFRNHGVNGERTDEIALRLDEAVNGDDHAAQEIIRLNALVRGLACGLELPLFPFHDTLVDPERPDRMPEKWTDDGNHPSVEGHRLLGEQAFRPF
jgi:hypothetical protein